MDFCVVLENWHKLRKCSCISFLLSLPRAWPDFVIHDIVQILVCFPLPHIKIDVNSGLKELQTKVLLYLGVTLCKYFTGNDAALLLCPGFPVWVCGAWIFGLIGIWASRRHFPAIGKLQHISYHRLTACSEVIVSIAIIVSTKATDMSLHGDKQKITKISNI